LGYHLDDWFTLNDFADTIIVDYHENRTLPSNLTWDSDIIQDVVFLYNWGTVFTQFGQEIQKQVLSTPILDYILDAANSSANGTSNLQLMLLSAHDDTLLTMLTPLGVVTPLCIYENFLSYKQFKKLVHPNCMYPTFASNVRMEVYKTGVPYIRLYYGGNEIWLCGNGSYCTMSQFTEIIQKTTNNGTLNNFDTRCNNPSPSVREEVKVESMKKDEEKSVGDWMKSHITWIFGGIVVGLVILNIWQTVKCMKASSKGKKIEEDAAEAALLEQQQA